MYRCIVGGRIDGYLSGMLSLFGVEVPSYPVRLYLPCFFLLVNGDILSPPSSLAHTHIQYSVAVMVQTTANTDPKFNKDFLWGFATGMSSP